MNNDINDLDEMLKRPVAYRASLAKALGSIKLALLLSQLYYWSDKCEDPEGWIYKTREEFYRELGMSRREQETARRQGRLLGVLEEKKKGLPRKTYFRINTEQLLDLLKHHRITGKIISWRKTSHKDGSDRPAKPTQNEPSFYTESTPKITSQTTYAAASRWKEYASKFFKEYDEWLDSDRKIIGKVLKQTMQWMERKLGKVSQNELHAFVSYWTDSPDEDDERGGSSQRWELENCFLVRKRLEGWMKRAPGGK